MPNVANFSNRENWPTQWKFTHFESNNVCIWGWNCFHGRLAKSLDNYFQLVVLFRWGQKYWWLFYFYLSRDSRREYFVHLNPEHNLVELYHVDNGWLWWCDSADPTRQIFCNRKVLQYGSKTFGRKTFGKAKNFRHFFDFHVLKGF